ncbi:hypothetical protein SNEBB_002750 [Seison nebaliae]|nr:hypothetical protein SNEBB_002750 [Seison nebaliae]
MPNSKGKKKKNSSSKKKGRHSDSRRNQSQTCRVALVDLLSSSDDDSSADYVSPIGRRNIVDEDIVVDESSIDYDKSLGSQSATGEKMTIPKGKAASSQILSEERSVHEQHREPTQKFDLLTTTGQKDNELSKINLPPPVEGLERNETVTLNPEIDGSRPDLFRQEFHSMMHDIIKRVKLMEEMFGEVGTRTNEKQNNTVLWREAASQTEELIQFSTSGTQTDEIQQPSVQAVEIREEVGATIDIPNSRGETTEVEIDVITALKRLLVTTTRTRHNEYKVPNDVLTNRKAASELYQHNPRKLVAALINESAEVASPSEDLKQRIITNLSQKWEFKSADSRTGDYDRKTKYGDKVHNKARRDNCQTPEDKANTGCKDIKRQL